MTAKRPGRPRKATASTVWAIRLPADLHARLVAKADAIGEEPSTCARTAIREWLDRGTR